MIVAFDGALGHGKSLMMTAIGMLIADIFNTKLGGNYPIKVENFTMIKSREDLLKYENGVLCLDEFWQDMDSRQSVQNVFMSRWILQSRKKNLIVCYTLQETGQIDKRLRDVTDWVIHCEKNSDGSIKLSFVDFRRMRVTRRFLIKDPSPFYGYYDRYGVVPLLE